MTQETYISVLQDGELVYIDWMPAKDQESGKIQSKVLVLVMNCSYGCVQCCPRFLC